MITKQITFRGIAATEATFIYKRCCNSIRLNEPITISGEQVLVTDVNATFMPNTIVINYQPVKLKTVKEEFA